jgi:hypothetical protein
LAGFLMGWCYANSQFHAVSGSTHRTSRALINEALVAGGGIGGAGFGGMLYHRLGMPIVWAACAGFLFLSALAQTAAVTIQARNRK